MPDHVYRIIEVAGSSQKSIEDAVQGAVVRRGGSGQAVSLLPNAASFFGFLHLAPAPVLRRPEKGMVPRPGLDDCRCTTDDDGLVAATSASASDRTELLA